MLYFVIMNKGGRPKSTNPKTNLFVFKMTKKEAGRLRWLAGTYAGGNISVWLRYAALAAERKFLVPRNKKGPRKGP